MAETGTTAEAQVSKPDIVVAIDLGSGRTDVVIVPGNVADYFNITADAVAATGGLIKRERKGYAQKKYGENLTDGTGTATGKQIDKAVWYDAPRLKKGSGKAITVPTETKLPNGKSFRTVRLNFPVSAVNGVISDWLNTHLKTHKPSWFRTPTGTRHAIAPRPTGVTDLNPGNTEPTASTGTND